MTEAASATRAAFAKSLAQDAANGRQVLLLGPLGSGKTHVLEAVSRRLAEAEAPAVSLDLFLAASTPENFLPRLAHAVEGAAPEHRRFLNDAAARAREGRAQASRALLDAFEALADSTTPLPFLFVLDEITEIRSLAYFEGLLEIEEPFRRVLRNARGVVAASSYPGLARDLFPALETREAPPLTAAEVEGWTDARGIPTASLERAVAFCGPGASALRTWLRGARESRAFEPEKTLAALLAPGGDLEALARRQYEVLLMRSRGYAVCKRTAEVVAAARGTRLTDLFPAIGRTAGASRQYLQWLVEVGLLAQTGKRYDFLDPLVGLWASLYLGRGGAPSSEEILAACLAGLDAVASEKHPAEVSAGGEEALDRHEPPRESFPRPRRPDRFEEID